MGATPATPPRRGPSGLPCAVVVLVSVAALLGGCGGSSSSGVAHLSTSHSTVSTGAAAGTAVPEAGSGAQRIVAYAHCMRTHGVPSFPEPVEGKIHIGPESGIDPGSGAFQSAEGSCHALLPNGGAKGAEPEGDPQQRLQGLLAFASCMRTHGVANFPDPNSQGELTTEMVGTAGVDVHAPDVQAAAQACLPAANGVLTEGDIKRAEGKAP